MTVRADLNISLDGRATTTDQTPENPFGDDWGRLVADYTATRTFRARVLGDTSGEGTTGIDEKYAHAYFEEVGAEIMGAGMFGLHLHADDPDWRGWWGDEPPFHVPVYVLTHTPESRSASTTARSSTSSTRRRLRLSLSPSRRQVAATSASAVASMSCGSSCRQG